jgi:hypothetical protein
MADRPSIMSMSSAGSFWTCVCYYGRVNRLGPAT